MKKIVLAIAALGMTIAACGGDDGTSTPKSLTLLAYDSFTPSEGIFDAFTKETGIAVEVVTGGDAGELVAKAVLTSGEPEGDVLWGVDNTLMSRALAADVFVPHRSAHVDDLDPQALALVTDDLLTPVDTGDVCVNYDKTWFADKGIEPPASLADLAAPDYKGLLVVQNPNTSSPGLAFLLAAIAQFGENGWQSYWSSLRENDVKIVDGWTEAYTVEFSGSSGKGSRPLVVSYASSPPAEVVYADPPVSEPPTAVIESTCFRQVEFAGVLRGTDNADAAGKLVDYLSGPTFQADLPLALFVNPANTTVDLPQVFSDFAATPASPLTMDPIAIERNRTTWLEAWRASAL
ncbi:MAG: thiamine ABC transporter substrate binding subunit [Actinomycetota bacterium]